VYRAEHTRTTWKLRIGLLTLVVGTLWLTSGWWTTVPDWTSSTTNRIVAMVRVEQLLNARGVRMLLHDRPAVSRCRSRVRDVPSLVEFVERPIRERT